MNRIERLLARELSLEDTLLELGYTCRRPAGQPTSNTIEVIDTWGEIIKEGNRRLLWNWIRGLGGLGPLLPVLIVLDSELSVCSGFESRRDYDRNR